MGMTKQVAKRGQFAYLYQDNSNVDKHANMPLLCLSSKHTYIALSLHHT